MQVNVSKQCERGLIVLKRNPFSDFFYTPLTIDAPCLSAIEKNIRNYKYKSLYEWIMDLRKMWAYFFTYYANNQEIYQKTSSLSQESENIYKDLENKSKDKDEMSEINKKIDTLQKDIQNMRGNPTYGNGVAPPNKKNDKYTLSIMDRAMTKNEKSALGLAIQTLHPSQMGGLIRIINDMVDIKDKTSLELDIDSLPTRKLRELEKYIKTCNKAKKDTNYTQNNTKPNNNNHNNTIESSTIHKLKTGLSQPTPTNANASTMSHSANSNNEKKEPDKKEKGLLNENDSISSSDSGKITIDI